MARPREFDPEIATQGAMEIFWKKGFTGTNLPDLLTAMGLTRGSFYKAFQDKERAYLLALERYDQQVVSKGVAALGACAGPSAVDCLMIMFAPPDDPQRGCFICNAMVELAPTNPDVAARSNAMADRLRQAFQGVVERFHPQVGSAGARESADLILHLYFGSQAIMKSCQAPIDWRSRLQQVLPQQR
ncbi:MAG: TetR/AcrR family transcriptional regulator [Pelagimonas sp.]|jgi:TetR/AcrR family transcriptional repressor of nem operon|nr:TetR/AcrR family transcriptional regulator [Pelagimonas sp.]